MKGFLKIGLFGYGNVGQGLYQILQASKSVKHEIVKICAKHPDKRRNISMDHFTFDRFDLLNNPEINLIVELIDDAEAAFDIVKYALENGKDVVTSNKKMLAQHLPELYELQKKYGRSLLYEASACGSIPIIRTLEEYYDNELLDAVSGIFNSSSNYILTKLFKENSDYDIALKQSQDLGYTETNSNLDIIGFDALYKLIIVAAHAYGVFVKSEEVLHHGIQSINRYDIQYANEKGYRIRQISMVRKVDDNHITMWVMPQFVEKTNKMYHVNYEYNAVEVEAAFSSKQYFDGKGAGGYPTGSGVLSDISANSYDYKYEYKKRLQRNDLIYTTDFLMEVYLRYFDEKNLQLFPFEKITARYQSKEYNYVVGIVNLKDILPLKDKLNTQDVLMVSTGKFFS